MEVQIILLTTNQTGHCTNSQKIVEAKVTKKLNELFDYAVSQMLPVIVSNTNLNQKDHTYWKTKAEEAGYEFEVKYFDITLDEGAKTGQ